MSWKATQKAQNTTINATQSTQNKHKHAQNKSRTATQSAHKTERF
jgi:hypothetical protein